MDRTQTYSTFAVGLTRRKKLGRGTKGMDREREANEFFYPQEGTPSEVPWDAREATRAMNELHMDD